MLNGTCKFILFFCLIHNVLNEKEISKFTIFFLLQETARQFLINAQEVKTKWKKKREYYDTRSRSGSDRTTSGTENYTNSREMNFMTSISSNENERLDSLAYNEQNERCSLINSTPVDVACIGKKKNVFSKY